MSLKKIINPFSTIKIIHETKLITYLINLFKFKIKFYLIFVAVHNIKTGYTTLNLHVVTRKVIKLV